MAEVLFFVSGKRTPFGANGGSLRDVNPTDLALRASKGALDDINLDPRKIDHIIYGNVLQVASDSIYSPRHIGLKLGMPEDRPALGVNRLCGTGFQVIVEAYHQMLAGDTKIALVGGAENMSMTPYVLRGSRWGLRMGHTEVSDLLLEALFDSYAGVPMAITAENLATQYRVSREDADEYALESQLRTKEAREAGKFLDEIVGFDLKTRKGEMRLLDDEHPKPDTTLEILNRLKPVFKKGGVVTAGNASGIVDGAASLIVANESAVKEESLSPLGRLVDYEIVGCDPKTMGIGPVPAIEKLLKKTGMSLGNIDLIEVNEAFAPQTIAVERALKIDRKILNVNGGAIAIGHPLAASGVRIVLSLLLELKRRQKKRGIASACIGGGQGIALMIEAFE